MCGKCANISWNSLLPRILGRPGQGVVAVVVAGASHGIEISLVLRYATIKKYREDRHAPQCQHYATGTGTGTGTGTATWTSSPFYDPSLEGRREEKRLRRRRRPRRGAQLDELWKAIYILPLIFYLLLLMFSLGLPPYSLSPLSLCVSVSRFFICECMNYGYFLMECAWHAYKEPEPEPQKMMRGNLLSLLNFLENLLNQLGECNENISTRAHSMYKTKERWRKRGRERGICNRIRFASVTSNGKRDRGIADISESSL